MGCNFYLLRKNLSAFLWVSDYILQKASHTNISKGAFFMKKLYFYLSCLLLCVTVSGCSPKNRATTVRVVTGIDISASSEDHTLYRNFTQGSDMSSVLNYLRLLDPYISVELDPDTFRSECYEIIVTYSDGNHTVYRQIYNDYFQENNGKWKRIDPKLGSRLQELLTDLPEQI